MIDFDDIDDWSPRLTIALRPHVGVEVIRALSASEPEYIEDACDYLFDLTARNDVIDATLAWIGSANIAGFHGTRLTEEEWTTVRKNGLRPLRAEARRPRLLRALTPHPRWQSVAERLDTEIMAHGGNGVSGCRENQVHLTLSRSGLVSGFNHYLTYGSEFDQHVAYALLGQEGVELLARDGSARVIQVAVPGEQALNAAHPHFTPDDLRTRGDVPNIVGDFLRAWSYRQAHPSFQSGSLKTDCGMVFQSAVPAAWIVGCDTLTD